MQVLELSAHSGDQCAAASFDGHAQRTECVPAVSNTPRVYRET